MMPNPLVVYFCDSLVNFLSIQAIYPQFINHDQFNFSFTFIYMIFRYNSAEVILLSAHRCRNLNRTSPHSEHLDAL